jgi:hypothetical protein
MTSGLLGDIRHTIAIARRTPATTIAILLTTAVAVGANTAMFSVLNAVLLTPLPYPDRDRIVLVSSRAPGFDRSDTSTLNFLDWQRQSPGFEYMVAYVTEPITLSNKRYCAKCCETARRSALLRTVWRSRSFRPCPDTR